MSAKDIVDYLNRLDAHLAMLSPDAALKDVESERKRVAHLEQAVAVVARDLGIIDGELAMRAQRQRERTAP